MSNPKPRHDRPTWASRVPREKIARLYATDAQGIVDEELIEDVGIGLFARIESIFKSREASAGQARCPLCDRQIDHDGMKDTILRCESCNWELTWDEYHKAKQGKHLAASGLTVFLQEFLQKYQTARSPKEKMVLIDTLIHRYHWELEGGLTRPGATDLIGGRQQKLWIFNAMAILGSGSNQQGTHSRLRSSFVIVCGTARSSVNPSVGFGSVPTRSHPKTLWSLFDTLPIAARRVLTSVQPRTVASTSPFETW